MAGTTVADEGSVMAAFRAAMEQFGPVPGARGYDRAAEIVQGIAEVAVRLGKVRPEAQGLSVARLRLCQTADGI